MSIVQHVCSPSLTLKQSPPPWTPIPSQEIITPSGIKVAARGQMLRLRLVTSQPFIVGRNPTDAEVAEWFVAQGFVKSGHLKWRHPETRHEIADAHSGFILP